jgi:hypothetical protein
MTEKRKSMQFGEQQPKYTCCINPYRDARFSRCPKCDGRTQIRQFALVIHVDPEGIYPTRIACKWCRSCGLIVVHKYELETTLHASLLCVSPKQVGSPYLIIGTLEMRIWTRLRKGFAFSETVKRWTADFQAVQRLTPGTVKGRFPFFGTVKRWTADVQR